MQWNIRFDVGIIANSLIMYKMKLNITQSEKLNSILSNRILQHSSYWVLSILFFGYVWGEKGCLSKMYIIFLIEAPVKMLAVYGTLYYLLPKLFFQKKIAKFVVFSILFMLFCTALQRVIILNTYLPYYYGIRQSSFSINELIDTVFSINTFLIFPLFTKTLEYIFNMQLDLQCTEKEKVKAELHSLKNQIHPHFLFNVLNNLYSLVLTKSADAGDVLLKLSELMRYMLYETSIAKAELSKELEFIKNYIALETIRYRNRLEISFITKGDPSGRLISPLLLLPFIENCFKHGIADQIAQGWIHIELLVTDSGLSFKTENSKELKPQQTVGGIGLENVKKRLNLEYKGKYQLEIADKGSSFSVQLSMEL